MFRTSRYLLAVLTVTMVALAQASADDRALSGEDLASVQEATRDLAREVEYLQDILVELRGTKVRPLYGQADAILAGIEDFLKSLKPDASCERLEKAFESLDGKVHKFLKVVQDLGPENRVLLRSAARVGIADEQLHFALFAPDALEGKSNQILERQIRALVIAAQQLDKTADYTLGTIQGKGVLMRDLHKLVEAAELFQQKLASETDRPKLRNDFAALNQAWETATRGIGELTLRENSHLLRSAGQVDRAHERLYRLLDVKGERPQLIIRT